MLLYHTLRQLSTEDADCCRFALPHRRPSGLISLRHRFTPPFPGGLSFPSGDGGQKGKQKAGSAGDQKDKPPPASTTAARSTGNAGASPAGRGKRPIPAPPGSCMVESVRAANGQMPGCRGRSPRQNNLRVSPFPAGEGGRGDRGQKSKLKAGQAGDKKGKPPAAFAIPAPGERTISNAEVPLPRSPLSLAAGTAPP